MRARIAYTSLFPDPQPTPAPLSLQLQHRYDVGGPAPLPCPPAIAPVGGGRDNTSSSFSASTAWTLSFCGNSCGTARCPTLPNWLSRDLFVNSPPAFHRRARLRGP